MDKILRVFKKIYIVNCTVKKYYCKIVKKYKSV